MHKKDVDLEIPKPLQNPKYNQNASLLKISTHLQSQVDTWGGGGGILPPPPPPHTHTHILLEFSCIQKSLTDLEVQGLFKNDILCIKREGVTEKVTTHDRYLRDKGIFQ